jgi:hypothetical protein
MAASARAFFSSDPPLGIKIESIAEQSVPNKGTFSNSALGAKAGLNYLISTTGSNQLTWLDTIVDTRFGPFIDYI